MPAAPNHKDGKDTYNTIVAISMKYQELKKRNFVNTWRFVRIPVRMAMRAIKKLIN